MCRLDLKRIIRVLVGCFMVMTASASAPAAGHMIWKHVVSRGGVEVWTRSVPGSDFEDFMARTVIDAPLDAVEQVIDDVPASEQWVPDCKEAKVIRTFGDSRKEILFVTEAPWPISDREALVISDKHKELKTGETVIDFHTVDDPSVPTGKGRVRIPAMNGRWVLSPVDREHTRITYSLKGDPGGYLPPQVSRMVSRKIPFNTLLGLKDMVHRSG